jgi:hypothetical protein
MIIPDKLLMISTILLAYSLVGCKGKTNSKAQKEAEEESSEGEGTATILYEYSDVQEGAWALSISAEVPVTIKRGEGFPEKWQVRGSEKATYYTRGQTLNPDGSPGFISCDFEVRIFFDGCLTNRSDNECQFQVKNFFIKDQNDFERDGSYPTKSKDICDPASALILYGALPERDWVFAKDNRVVNLPRPEGQIFKATIKDIHWPEDMNKVNIWD